MSILQQAKILKDRLGLGYEPIGLSAITHNESVAGAGKCTAPSACSLWRKAEQQGLIADAAAHNNCKIGAHVMGFSLDAADGRELGALVEILASVSYIEPDEAAALPRMPESKAWRYAPLQSKEEIPELVLLWLDARQTMLLQEAMGSADWVHDRRFRTTGRPACGALPLAYHTERPVLSFGCAGMRTFTEIPDSHMLMVIPGKLLEGMCAGLERAHQSNQAVQSVYDQQKTSFG